MGNRVMVRKQGKKELRDRTETGQRAKAGKSMVIPSNTESSCGPPVAGCRLACWTVLVSSRFKLKEGKGIQLGEKAVNRLLF